MLNDFYKQLKSGTDIRGIAGTGAPDENVNLTTDVIRKISAGFILWLSEKTAKPAADLTVSIGRDSRVSGPAILSVMKQTAMEYGVHIIDCGLSTTPAMFMSILDLNCDGAVEITASHHPADRNGLKFFTKSGGVESSDIKIILQYAQEGKSPGYVFEEICTSVDYMQIYADKLCNIFKQSIESKDYEHPLAGYKIAVDAGNGAGGFYAEKVLAVLGADISGSRFLDPDGYFPNHVPNPENEEAIKACREAVVNSNSDLGIIFDTDGDRGAAVDSKGNELNRNRLVALAASIALDKCPGGTIVTDSITSDGLKDFIEKTLRGKHLRYKRGYRNVINKAIELNRQGIDAPLAIETSGHASFRENYFLDDGSYLCTQIIIKMVKLKKEGKDIDSLLEKLKESAVSREIRIGILEKEFREYGEKIISDLKIYADNQENWCVAKDSYEGVRVSFGKDDGDGWFLLRLSVHDPVLPLNIESSSTDGAAVIYRKLINFLKHYDKLEGI